MIPYGRQDINQADIDAVIDVLRSDFLTQGPAVPQFEAAVAIQCGAAHAVALSNATAALHVACLALDVSPGDIVWTSPITFVASANCARYCGADVDFVDIDPGTFNMNPAALEAKLEEARRAGKRLPKVVIPVHFGGQSCDMVGIAKLAKEYGFRVIEDASHAIGGRYQDQPVGNCKFSDITVFSFHPVKIVTTGEGGMALTQDANLASRMALLRSHGITRDPTLMTREPDGPWYYQQVTLGFNYRMTDLQAALGTSQMQRLDAFIARRQVLAQRYDAAFTNSPVRFQKQLADSSSAYHLYVIRVPEANRKKQFEAFRAAGIGVNLHYIPVYLQPDFARLGFSEGYCPAAEAYYREAISIPMYPAMTDAEQEFVISTVQEL